MDALMKLSREVQVVLGGTALYLIFSFFDWQQVSYLGITAGRSEWSGVGVVAALIAIALLAWEIYRVVAADVELGSVEPGQVSAGLALALLVFTVITFVSHNEARHWPAWIGLLLSIVITVFALKRSMRTACRCRTSARWAPVAARARRRAARPSRRPSRRPRRRPRATRLRRRIRRRASDRSTVTAPDAPQRAPGVRGLAFEGAVAARAEGPGRAPHSLRCARDRRLRDGRPDLARPRADCGGLRARRTPTARNVVRGRAPVPALPGRAPRPAARDLGSSRSGRGRDPGGGARP